MLTRNGLAPVYHRTIKHWKYPPAGGCPAFISTSDDDIVYVLNVAMNCVSIKSHKTKTCYTDHRSNRTVFGKKVYGKNGHGKKVHGWKKGPR